jgi:hypothetical protein
MEHLWSNRTVGLSERETIDFLRDQGDMRARARDLAGAHLTYQELATLPRGMDAAALRNWAFTYWRRARDGDMRANEFDRAAQDLFRSALTEGVQETPNGESQIVRGVADFLMTTYNVPAREINGLIQAERGRLAVCTSALT